MTFLDFMGESIARIRAYAAENRKKNKEHQSPSKTRSGNGLQKSK